MWNAELSAKTLMSSEFSVRAWARERDIVEPIIKEKNTTLLWQELRGESDSDDESMPGLMNLSESERADEGASDSDDIYESMPGLMDVSESEEDADCSDNESDDSEDDEIYSGDEELGISRDDPLSKHLHHVFRHFRARNRSSVAPTRASRESSESGTNSGKGESAPEIECAMAQPNKSRARSRAKQNKPTENVWETLEENSAKARDDKCVIPHPIILTVYINGRACRALLDSGAFSDFVSTTLVDSLGLKRNVLPQPLTLQMAVQGSRSKINVQTTVNFSYSTINCEKTFDIINIASYDMILGTPFIWQHKIIAGMNPTRVAIGSNLPLHVQGEDAHTILGATAAHHEDELEEVREMLRHEAKELCEDASTSALPPFRAINHHIPLIDESKVYKFRPSKCPRALEHQWHAKREEYLGTGRWRVATGSNPIPLLLIQKPRKSPDEPIRLRACFDKRELNANTKKLASPMPDQTEVLEWVAAKKYRTVIDGRDAYEQIRVVEEDVPKTLFNTPDGLMESLVLQQGDCNGPATYQTLMNHIFAGYIGVWMDVYLDDIIIYSDTLKDHIKHIRTVFEILKREKLFLNPKKMQFLSPNLEILGHHVTDEGIKMDPHKVDSIAKWPTPTNKELLASFIGAVGYLADGVRGIRIPMAVLSKLTGQTKVFRWGPTEQRSFERVKELVNEYHQKTRVPLSYAKDAPKIWLVTDASMTGAAGHVCQGDDWKTAKPVAFWSGKFSSAEQAYPTHEQELLAIVESLKRFRHHLLGTKFTIVTDHEKLDRFMTQKNLSRRQTRWLETLNDFDFDIKWSPGKLNVFADALSRIYSNDAKGTERADSEYVSKTNENEEEDSSLLLFNLAPSTWPSRPIRIGNEVEAEMQVLMAQATTPRRNPGRNKQKRTSLRESEESTDSPEPEVKPKRGRGRPRKSVPETTPKPRNSLTDAEASVAPVLGTAAEPAHSERQPAKADRRPPQDSRDEGESEMEDAPMNSHKKPSKRTEYYRKESEKAQLRREQEMLWTYDSEDEGESEMENPVAPKAKKDEESSAKRQQEIRNELIETNQDAEEGRLPNLAEESSGVERTMDVRLTDIIKEVEFPSDLEGRYGEDKFFKTVIESPDHYKNFEVVGKPGKEIVYMKDMNRRVLCVPDVSIGSRKAREIVITHAHSILAHLGTRKTLWYLRDNVWWKDMIKDIADYCASCDVCARTKSSNQKPAGLLHPLKVPKRPWEQVGVDFVGPLPEAKNRYGAFDQVMVIIDHLTSMVHLIPTKINYRARQIAEIFYDTIYKLHGLPERIISDRDKIFTSIFWKNLHKLMRVDLKLSSTYHPQTDGATERANRTMVQMIRQAIGENDTKWVERLPAIEWAMNAARSETTGFSPFFLNYGYRPRPLLWNNAGKDEYPGVHAFAQKMKDAIMKAHDAILEKRVKQTRLANKSRKPAVFSEGDNVYLSTKNLKLPKGKSRKLVPKYIGPYKIAKELVMGTTYRLELPAELKARGIHNAFHASLLRIHVPNCDTRFPGRQFDQLAAFGAADEEWEVQKIANHSGVGEDALFELEWTNGEVTWEPYNRVKDLEAFLEYLEAMGVSDAAKLPKGAGNPPEDDLETFAGMLSIDVDEGGTDINPPNVATNAPVPTIPPPFLHPIPIPPSASTTEIMSRHNRNFKVTMDPPTHLRVQRTRNGTPHPYPRITRLTPAYEPADVMPDSIDIAVAVATAGTTFDVAKEIRQAVATKTRTTGGRAKFHDMLERNPSKFFHYIGVSDILKCTVNSATANASGTPTSGPATAKPTAPKPAKGRAPAEPQPEITPEVTNLIRDFLAISQLGAAIIRLQYQTPSGSNAPTDPRIRTEKPERTDETSGFDFGHLMESMNGDTIMSSAEDSTGSTKNDTLSEEFETISMPIEEHVE